MNDVYIGLTVQGRSLELEDIKDAMSILKRRRATEGEYYPENKEYIRALDIAKAAVYRQIPKKPLVGIDIDGNKFRICRECSAIVKDTDWRADYCPDCGQALDWSGEDGRST